MTVLCSLLMITLVTVGAVTCLNRPELQFIGQVIKVADRCTVLLMDLDATDTQVISEQISNPLLSLRHTGDSKNSNDHHALLSMRNLECVVAFGIYDKFNRKLIRNGGLLRYTRYKSIFLFEVAHLKGNDWATEDVILIQFTLKGNLLLYLASSSNNSIVEMVWKSKSQQIVNGEISHLLSQHRATLKGRNVTLSFYKTVGHAKTKPSKYYGYELQIFNYIARNIGFEVQVKNEFQYRFSTKIKTRQWAGSIINGTSQFGLGSLLMRRPEDFMSCPIEYSPQTFVLDGVYLFPKPKPLTPFLNFLRPFSVTVWLAFIFSTIICALVAAVLYHYDGKMQISFLKILFDLYGAACNQNLKATLVSPSTGHFYIIFGFWIVVMFIKDAAYGCNLRAAIMKKDYEKPVESDDDIVQQDRDLYVSYDTSFHVLYASSTSPVRKFLYDRAVARDTFSRLDNHGEWKLKNEKKAIQEGGVRMIDHDLLPLTLLNIEKRFGYQPYQASKNTIDGSVTYHLFWMQAGQPWAEEFNRNMLRLIDGGITVYSIRKLFPTNKDTGSIKKNQVPELESYRIEHILGWLILFGIGLLISLFALGFEVCFAAQSTFDLTRIVTVY